MPTSYELKLFCKVKQNKNATVQEIILNGFADINCTWMRSDI